MNKLAWLEAVARQFFHLINIAVVIDLINPYHFLSNETKLKLGFAYFKYVWDMLPERECLCAATCAGRKINVCLHSLSFSCAALTSELQKNKSF